LSFWKAQDQHLKIEMINIHYVGLMIKNRLIKYKYGTSGIRTLNLLIKSQFLLGSTLCIVSTQPATVKEVSLVLHLACELFRLGGIDKNVIASIHVDTVLKA
jgi:hypothetical protein